MIIITAKDKKFEYKGCVVILFGNELVIIKAAWTDGLWSGNVYDSFWIEDVESIEGVD